MITYKNITDVEVLEQASENTKVLVNEGGELMQAPYSNFEDKMKDAEVLEEIPESAKVLVNDGGELKQVVCKEMGGRFDIRIDNGTIGLETVNRTYDEIMAAYNSGAVLNVILNDGSVMRFAGVQDGIFIFDIVNYYTDVGNRLVLSLYGIAPDGKILHVKHDPFANAPI